MMAWLPTWIELVHFSQWFFLGYFICISGIYLSLNIVCAFTLKKYMPSLALEGLPQVFSGMEPPVSIIVPAYNESAIIIASIHSMLHLNYPQFEILVVNDESTDDTLKILKQNLEAIPFPEPYRRQLETEQVKAIYRSTKYPNIRIIDKEKGGKADSINAGINCALYPLFCVVDADSILQRNSLKCIIQPFLEDQRVVAAGGTIRIANGCQVSGGFLKSIGLSTNGFALVQVVEYIRAFLMGRVGWASLDALLIISGAFGVFRKETVIEVGGYKPGTVGEDMELIVRIHRFMREQKRKYKIVFLPDPVAWTEVPEHFRSLMNQRIRWQQGLSESLFGNLGLMFSRNGGAVGWLAFPFMLIFEWFGPVIEVAGYILMGLFYWLGYISWPVFAVFLFASIGLGFLLSVSSLLIEEVSFHIYSRPKQLAWLIFGALIDSLFFRQLNSIWRCIGLLRWMFMRKGKWGSMQRQGNWHEVAHDLKQQDILA